jgi:hypothetical protein
MLTIAVMISGPHRYDMLRAAVGSIPMNCSGLSQVILSHQGGVWDWGGPLKEEMRRQPKVRILEFPEKVDLSASFNRTLDHVDTPWVLMLPDDDFLLRRTMVAGLDALATYSGSRDLGLIAFGWYYLKRGRYLASHVKRGGLLATFYYTPKMCSTFLNMRRLRELGGFDERFGGFCDTALFGRLCFDYDALICETPLGVYRMHDGQVSARPDIVYGPHVKDLITLFRGFASNAQECERFEKYLMAHINRTDRHLITLLQNLIFSLRSYPQAVDLQALGHLRKWSSLPTLGDSIRIRSLLR